MSLVNTTSVQYTLYPTVVTTFTVCPFDTIRDCEGPTTLMLIYNPNATPKYSSFKMALLSQLGHPVFLTPHLSALSNAGTYAMHQGFISSMTTLHKS